MAFPCAIKALFELHTLLPRAAFSHLSGLTVNLKLAACTIRELPAPCWFVIRCFVHKKGGPLKRHHTCLIAGPKYALALCKTILHSFSWSNCQRTRLFRASKLISNYLELLSSCHEPVWGQSGLGSAHVYQATVKCAGQLQHKCVQQLKRYL